jgi:hypothetical protein
MECNHGFTIQETEIFRETAAKHFSADEQMALKVRISNDPYLDAKPLVEEAPAFLKLAFPSKAKRGCGSPVVIYMVDEAQCRVLLIAVEDPVMLRAKLPGLKSTLKIAGHVALQLLLKALFG